MDKYDKMTNETLNKAYADFLEGIKSDKLGKTTARNYVDSKIMINGYEIKPELMDKIKSFEDFNIFLENCKNNAIEDSNRQKTASVLSRTIATNYDEKEIKLLVEYLQEMLKKESN